MTKRSEGWKGRIQTKEQKKGPTQAQAKLKKRIHDYESMLTVSNCMANTHPGSFHKPGSMNRSKSG